MAPRWRRIHHINALNVQICRSVKYHKLRKNELLFKQGAQAECFYIVVRGYVRVIIDGAVVCCLGPGQSFGEKGVTGTTAKERAR